MNTLLFNFYATDIDPVATGSQIRLLIKAHKYTVASIANALAVSEQAMYKVLRGDNLPSMGNLYNLSRILGTTVDELLVPYKVYDEDRDRSSFFCFFLTF